MEAMMNFNDQRVLVIGGSSGIGLATARLAARLGGKVTVASRSAAKLEAVARANAGQFTTVVLDVTDAPAVAEFGKASGQWDHVVVTGSQVTMAAVRELPLETALQAFDSKFWGFYRVARALDIAPGGSLSVVAGYLATRPVAGRALMGAINAALESLVQGLALELKPVRVNAVSPAVINTEMWAGMDEASRQAMFDRVAANYPAGCIGQPEDIARQLLLLAATRYATGTIVTLDGGASIG